MKANPVIIGELEGIPNSGIPENDISEKWFIIADDYNGDYLTIDLDSNYLGRCYDSYYELHPGNSPIIAKSFTELLERLIENKGQHWYWLRQDFISYGNAYG